MSPAARLSRLRRASGSCRSSRNISLVIALALTELFSGQQAFAAGPLPQGGRFVGGSGSIAQNGTNLNITQTGSRGIIEWDSFSIGPHATVSINNGTGATLNRVTGNDFSAILGTLSGTGSIYLVNPHGVLIGRNGVVSTGGRFVASTLDIPNDTFLNPPAIGGSVYTGSSTANVINLGRLISSGGDVFLISANKVTNAGTIDAPTGNAELAVGRQVRLLDGTDQQVFVDVGSGGTVTNTGSVQAAIINLQAADGNIFALAGHSGALRATGTASRAGHVWLVANTDTATSVINTGSVDARGAQISARNADGSGGAVDMSGKEVEVGDADVQAKTWNITTGDFITDASTARTLSASLSHGASINVDANGGDGLLGATGEGDIAIDASIRWHGAASLTLDAAHSLTIAPNATIANRGTGSLILNADWHGFDNGGSVTNLGTIDWSRSTGIVTALYDMNGRYTPGTLRSNPSWSAAPFSGLVTQITAYQLINYLADLNAVNNNLAGNYALGNYALGNLSIDFLDPVNFGGIGTAATPFTGQFDGMGHVVTGLNISGDADTGLFGVIGKTGVVRNFDLTQSSATSSAGPVGLLAGTNYGLIVQVGVFGSVQSTGDTSSVAGGIVGENRGLVEQSFAAVQVSGAGMVGGLAGTNDGCIEQSVAEHRAGAGAKATIGGLVGTNHGGINQSNAIEILTGGAVVGGLVGSNAGVIRESYAKSTLAPDPGATTGGIAGTNSGRIAADVFWNSESSGATAGVGSGTPVASSSGLTDEQLTEPASFGPTWDFSANGVWVVGFPYPTLRWLSGS
ncbi:filamentous hemagglutinin family protein [Paraburkholderia sp. HC6.4b]|uniref:two-partner secretion domain-containing protein n=1 Tax=unclassified Paraburkholderia TaxID=2615204 RepID=UPI00160C48D4|nr:MULTISPECIES: filamentous hemagglutinin N-terminal domain-containing protein [unclassified Paraburkholderia]MBB5411332.1 filamentous hemagglutinin family protein [Paraburkholderia sp. HC6.4b]MBB5449867.1 filamentous hemagglutinin family protein [Paraburkholderia sp. Kb1A]